MDTGYNHAPACGGAWVGAAVGAGVGASVGWAGVPEYQNNIDAVFSNLLRLNDNDRIILILTNT